MSKRIEAIKSKEYEFVNISINWEFTLKKKNGEIVESSRSWKNDNRQTEESLLIPSVSRLKLSDQPFLKKQFSGKPFQHELS